LPFIFLRRSISFKLEFGMSDSLRNLLRELRTGLVAIYGDRLNGVYLFGSYARKEADPESDVDVLVVLDRIDCYTQEVATTSPLISRLSLQHGVSVSRMFVSPLDWADRQTPFLANVREEAIPA
jgi:predicted nucleotidyltransferase